MLLERRGFTLIAGPCVLQDEVLHEEIAGVLVGIRDSLGITVIFKGSFDKANRSQPDAERGPGLERGLNLLHAVKAYSGLLLLTDIHEPSQAALAASVADVLQIPAFLCRQTDLLAAAGRTGRAVNIKKGQWMGLPETYGAIRKVRPEGSTYPVSLTERGTFFGYGDLVVDFRSTPAIQHETGVPVYFDGTHSIQRPGLGVLGTTGASYSQIELIRAACAAGCDGLYIEVHPRPWESPSDSATILPLGMLKQVVQEAVSISKLLYPSRF